MAFFYDSDYVSPQESDLEAPPAISSVMPDPAIQRENAEKITSWVEDIASISRHLTQIRATLEKCKSKQEQPQQEGEDTDSADTLVERLDALIAFQTDIEEAFWLTKALCKLTGKDLKRLGVVREAVPVPIEPIRRGLRKALGTNNLNLYEEAADAKAQALHSDLLSLTGRVIMNVGDSSLRTSRPDRNTVQSEASARIPIDSCIIHVSALCDGRFRLGGLPAGKLFLITETSVPRVKSGPQDSKEHPVLRNVGALAGRLDYLLTKVPGYLDGIKPRECQVLNNALDDFAEAPTSITDLDDLARPGVLLTVVEAKRFDIKDDALLEAVPQAIGEALVL
ncbi:hypothetical protein FRB90_011341 [Tulasnella sp. 427]|nr:hypothetical protein FRB90_011341 [Tulasnella sp. 427]